MRDLSLDIFKTLLVVEMVAAHFIQLDVQEPCAVARAFSLAANLVTFSGFFYCFGRTAWIAYLSKERDMRPRMLRNALRIMAAYYISALSVTLLSDGLTVKTAVKIILLHQIGAYSEFLLSFASLQLLICIFAYRIKRLRGVHIAAIGVLCLGMTLFPYEAVPYWLNPVGILVGTTHFACFPVVQYLPFFLLGLYHQRVSKSERDIPTIFIFVVSIACFIYSFAIPGNQPCRFSPDARWILSGIWAVLLGYGICRLIALMPLSDRTKRMVVATGRSTLPILVASNILFFAIRTLYVDSGNNVLQNEFTICATFVLLTVLIYKKVNANLNSIKSDKAS